MNKQQHRMMNKLVYLLLGAFSLASCGDAEDVTQPEGLGGETVEVIQDIRVNVLPMRSIVGASTRSADVEPEKGEALTVTYESDAATRVNEDKTDLTEAESRIRYAYIVQFNGTEPTSTVAWSSGNVSEQLLAGTPITCSFKMTGGKKNRVYVVTGRTSAPPVGQTLSAFEDPISYTASDKVSSIGLPMSAMQDVGVGDAFDTFQLKSLVAKVTFTCNSPGATLKLCRVSFTCSYFTQAAGDSPFRPVNLYYNSNFSILSGTSYYVPENLSGRNNLLLHHYTRALGMASGQGMYVEITKDGTVYNVLLGDGTPQDFNVVGGYSYNIKTTISGKDPYDLRVGNPIPVGTPITDLNPEGKTANCYIVGSNNWCMFNNTVMGNGAITPESYNSPAITPSKLAPARAEVLWETRNTGTTPIKGAVVAPNIYPLKDRFLFKAGASEGNAVIAARSATGGVIWSWHIWHLNIPPQGVGLRAIPGVTTTNELVMMDCNLGALGGNAHFSVGLFYQWGRKDPMPGTSILSVYSVMATNPNGIPVVLSGQKPATVEQMIGQPTVFVRSNDDWCTTVKDNLWGTAGTVAVRIYNKTYNANPGMKSIYDPCPVGWRVPPAYVFAFAYADSEFPYASFRRNFRFITSKSSDFYLYAAGYRVGTTGQPSNTNGGETLSGHYWTASPSSTDRGAALLFDDNTMITPDSNQPRANAYSIRCVKE